MNEPRRRTDYVLIAQWVSIIGALYVVLIKPSQWDETTKKVEQMEPKVAQIDVINQHVNDIDKKMDLAIELLQSQGAGGHDRRP